MFDAAGSSISNLMGRRFCALSVCVWEGRWDSERRQEKEEEDVEEEQDGKDFMSSPLM